MPESLIVASLKLTMNRQSGEPLRFVAERTASWNCASVQLPMPTSLLPVMFGASPPSPIGPWQPLQEADTYTAAPLVALPVVAAPAVPVAAPAVPVDAPAVLVGAPAVLVGAPAVPVAPAVPGAGVVESLLPQAEARAASAALMKQTVAKRCKVLKTGSFFFSWGEQPSTDRFGGRTGGPA